MATHVNVEKLRQGLKSLEPATPHAKFEGYSKMRSILLMIALDSIDYSAFEKKDVRQLLELYSDENIDALEENLGDVTSLVLRLSNLPPGGDSNSNVQFF